MQNIFFFDTTLRDGEQTPGVRLSRAHKAEIAKQLEDLGVDIIEAGFPCASEGDFLAVAEVAATVKRATVCGLCRAVPAEVARTAEALAAAVHPRIHVFLATSDLHLAEKLHITRDEALVRVREAVTAARALCADVQFSAEDAGRSDRAFLLDVLRVAVDAGATTLNIPDTVGYNTPQEYGALIGAVAEAFADRPDIIISAHCHDDLGNATANSLAAIKAGARQVECTIGGLGERAGNAALEEIVMNLQTRRDYYGVTHNIVTREIVRTARMVSSFAGNPIPKNKPIIGANAFVHASGIHQHGVLSDARTYEIMTPESVGFTADSLALGKLSGKHAFAKRLEVLGYALSAEAVTACFAQFKNYADKKTVEDADIRAIVNEYLDTLSPVYELCSFQIQSGNKLQAMAMVTMGCGGETSSEAAVGDGPIDAGFQAINRLSGAEQVHLESYDIRAVTEGKDALGEARVTISIDGARYSGRSVSPDIIAASLQAYVNALNKWAHREK